MTPHVAVVVAWCSFVNPAVDKIAGGFPKALPLQVAVTLSDVACVVILHVLTVTNVLEILSDLEGVAEDLPSRRKGSPGYVFVPPHSHGR
jgi:hypothetical protein